jgi:hypothetical protein
VLSAKDGGDAGGDAQEDSAVKESNQHMEEESEEGLGENEVFIPSQKGEGIHQISPSRTFLATVANKQNGFMWLERDIDAAIIVEAPTRPAAATAAAAADSATQNQSMQQAFLAWRAFHLTNQYAFAMNQMMMQQFMLWQSQQYRLQQQQQNNKIERKRNVKSLVPEGYTKKTAKAAMEDSPRELKKKASLAMSVVKHRDSGNDDAIGENGAIQSAKDLKKQAKAAIWQMKKQTKAAKKQSQMQLFPQGIGISWMGMPWMGMPTMEQQEFLQSAQTDANNNKKKGKKKRGRTKDGLLRSEYEDDEWPRKQRKKPRAKKDSASKDQLLKSEEAENTAESSDAKTKDADNHVETATIDDAMSETKGKDNTTIEEVVNEENELHTDYAKIDAI